jgi:hypothetical protein
MGDTNMRKEDEQAIKRTVALLKCICQEHTECSQCPLYVTTTHDNCEHHGCVVDIPPAFVDADEIIKCFT